MCERRQSSLDLHQPRGEAGGWGSGAASQRQRGTQGLARGGPQEEGRGDRMAPGAREWGGTWSAREAPLSACRSPAIVQFVRTSRRRSWVTCSHSRPAAFLALCVASTSQNLVLRQVHPSHGRAPRLPRNRSRCCL